MVQQYQSLLGVLDQMKPIGAAVSQATQRIQK